jgi:TonB family protein
MIKKNILSIVAFLLTLTCIAQTQPKDTIYRLVEVYPSFKGGNNELQKFIRKTAKYPTEALKAKREGIVDVHFVVKKDGSLQQIKAIQKGNTFIEQEAARIVKLMPKWNAGLMYNKTVDTYFSISILFSRKDSSVSWFTGENSFRASDERFIHNGNQPEEVQGTIELAEEGDYLTADPVGMDDEVLLVEAEPREAATEEPVLTFAEQMAEFPGDLNEYLAKNIQYPALAKENKIEGKVIIQFIITKDGKITNAEVIKKAGWGLDQEAQRVIRNMPNWTPAKQNGKPVNLRYTLPIHFKLK